VLRRTRFGMELRAVGCNELARLSPRSARQPHGHPFLTCCARSSRAAGGLLLAGQVGVGDPTVGQNYTLQSISVPWFSAAPASLRRPRLLPRRAGRRRPHPGNQQRHRLSRLSEQLAILAARRLDTASAAMYSQTRSAVRHG
jgi:hypothetical protein